MCNCVVRIYTVAYMRSVAIIMQLAKLLFPQSFETMRRCLVLCFSIIFCQLSDSWGWLIPRNLWLAQASQPWTLAHAAAVLNGVYGVNHVFNWIKKKHNKWFWNRRTQFIDLPRVHILFQATLPVCFYYYFLPLLAHKACLFIISKNFSTGRDGRMLSLIWQESEHGKCFPSLLSIFSLSSLR